MKAKVTTTDYNAAKAFEEELLLAWGVEFDLYISKTHGYIYTFDDEDDLTAYKRETEKALTADQFNALTWN